MGFKDYIEFIKEKHKGQKRIQGTPYYLHPLEVSNILAEKGLPEDYQVAGLFHDLLEDTDTTYEDILAISNQDIAKAVRLVTKKKDMICQNIWKELCKMIWLEWLNWQIEYITYQKRI